MRILLLSILFALSGCNQSEMVSAGHNATIIKEGALEQTDSIAFGAQSVNAPATAVYTVENIGTSTLTILGTEFSGSGNFDRTGGTCTTLKVLAEGQTCTINLTFTPTTMGPKSAGMKINYRNTSGYTNFQMVSLTGESNSLGVTIEQNGAQTDPSITGNVVFDVYFDVPIDPATFTASDIQLAGTATSINWIITNPLADNQNFVLTADTSSAVVGTIVPYLASGSVLTPQTSAYTDPIIGIDGNPVDVSSTLPFSDSSSSDNSVNFDNTPLTVTVNQAVAQTDPTNSSTIVFTAVFSKTINTASFTIADIVNAGATATWAITNPSGDARTFTLTATMTGQGTITPTINATSVTSQIFFHDNNASTSTDNNVLFDSILPVDNTASLQFTNAFDVDGNDIDVSWTAFTDVNLSYHRITTYTDAACTTGATTHPSTASATNADAASVDGLADGTYWATVTAYDVAENSTTSACSADSIIIDTTAPQVSSIVRKSGEQNPTIATTMNFTVTFSEAIPAPVVGDFDVTFSNGTDGTIASVTAISTTVYEVAINTTALEGDYTLNVNDADTTIADAAGNLLADNTVASSETYTRYQNAFIMTWDPGLGPVYSATLPLVNDVTYTYNMIIDWGDGPTLSYVTSFADADKSHTYAVAGPYTIKVYGVMDGLAFANGSEKDKILDVTQWGSNKWKTMEQMFYGCTMIGTLTAVDIPDLSLATSMKETFRDATSFNTAVTTWTTTTITNMNGTFQGATAFDQPLDSWSTGAVTNMQDMFNGAITFNRPLPSWTVSGVLTMQNMFTGATAFSQDLSGWVVNPTVNHTNFIDLTAIVIEPTW